MNYKVGDEVVCIDATPAPDSGVSNWSIRAGGKYVVTRISKCCISKVQLKGLQFWDDNQTKCGHCGKNPVADGYRASRFIKLDKLTESSTEQLTEKV